MSEVSQVILTPDGYHCNTCGGNFPPDYATHSCLVPKPFAPLPINQVLHDDCLDVLRTLEDNSVDSIVTDPPAGIAFMGKGWDNFNSFPTRDRKNGQGTSFGQSMTNGPEWSYSKEARETFITFMTDVFTEALRVLKPGGHAFVWALPRTSHWTALALEDAGFEIRDSVAHMFGSGFPKSLSVDKAIDKHLKAEREVIGRSSSGPSTLSVAYEEGKLHNSGIRQKEYDITSPATPEAQQWSGWGSALKPSHERWWKVRKPLTTVPYDEIIAQTTNLLEALLWLLSPAKLVESPLLSSRQEQHATRSSSVRWIVDVLNTMSSPASCDLMDTFNSRAEAETYLSIAWLWNSILDALCSSESKYTTSTITSLITGLKTLNSWISAIMPESIADLAQHGLWARATTAEGSSRDGGLSWKHIPIPSAQERVGMPITRNIVNALVSSAELLSLDIPTNIVSSAQEDVMSDGEQNTEQQPTDRAKKSSPSHEVWWLCRKPLTEKSIAANVLRYGTGALNIDISRIGLQGVEDHKTAGSGAIGTSHGIYGAANEMLSSKQVARAEQGLNPRYDPSGRFPANTLFSHSVFCVPLGEKRVRGSSNRGKPIITKNPSNIFKNKPNVITQGYADEEGMELVQAWQCVEECPVRVLDEQSGVRKSDYARRSKGGSTSFFGSATMPPMENLGYNDQGTASRYFQCFPPEDMPPFLYVGKASRRERSEGCEALPSQQGFDKNTSKQIAHVNHETGETTYSEYHPSSRQNTHPTVKPLSLLKYLIRMITPANGIVLDFFAGSGSTGVACVQSGFRYILVEREQEYIDIIHARLAHAHKAMPVQETGEYECHPSCPIRILGEQSGVLTSKWGKSTSVRTTDNVFGMTEQSDRDQTDKVNKFIGDSGKADRFFKAFPPGSLFEGMDEVSGEQESGQDEEKVT